MQLLKYDFNQYGELTFGPQFKKVKGRTLGVLNNHTGDK